MSTISFLAWSMISNRAASLWRMTGAWVIQVAREDDNKEMPPLILVNSRGAAMYGTTDLATIIDRVDAHAPERILYVVDLGQSLHFEQVFRASERAGYMDESQLEHIKFGTVNGPDGKRLRTREGGTFKLADLNQMALDAVVAKMDEGGRVSSDIPAEERAQIAQLVARAALRFADLQNTRTTNYVFNLDTFTSFEGKTGPYLLYQVVRIKSLLRKAAAEGAAPGDIKVESDAERALVLALEGFDGALQLARAKRMPHHLCEHVYGLAQAFSAFYGAHPIATEPDPVIRASRLGLCEAVAHQLETGLSLLGIDAPERM